MHRAKVSSPRNCGKMRQPLRTKCGLGCAVSCQGLQVVTAMERRKEKLRDRIVLWGKVLRGGKKDRRGSWSSSCFLLRNRLQRAPFWVWGDLDCSPSSSLVNIVNKKPSAKGLSPAPTLWTALCLLDSQAAGNTQWLREEGQRGSKWHTQQVTSYITVSMRFPPKHTQLTWVLVLAWPFSFLDLSFSSSGKWWMCSRSVTCRIMGRHDTE